jgi:hypothetical protein
VAPIKVVFLDIDGVLNSARFLAEHARPEGASVVDGTFDTTAHIDPERVARLNRLIAASGAEVVLSSSWRLLFGLERTQASLAARGFAYELVDATPRIFGSDRHAEIKAFIAALPIAPSFVVLDDDASAGFGLEARFVLVPDGLEDSHVAAAQRILEQVP